MDSGVVRCCAAPETNPNPPTTSTESAKGDNPVLCLVPLDGKTGAVKPEHKPRAVSARTTDDFELLDEAYIKKHFKLPSRPLYLDPSKRPLITFPMTQETSNHFNMARKNKINQNILDGMLDSNAAISSPGTHPYPSKYKGTENDKDKSKEDEEEVIYILQLPDWETLCPIHNQTVRTPRFIWNSCKTSKEKTVTSPGGPSKRPKPWLLSRHTDFDLMSQW